jgi:hypothetical protein
MSYTDAEATIPRERWRRLMPLFLAEGDVAGDTVPHPGGADILP